MLTREEIRRNYKPIVKISYPNRFGRPEFDEYAELYHIAPGIIYTVIQGKMHLSTWHAVAGDMSELIVVNQPCDMFHDCFGMYDYEKECRTYSSSWMGQHDFYIKKSYVGTKSKVVAAASKIISLATGGKLYMTSNEDRFYSALNEKLVAQEVYL